MLEISRLTTTVSTRGQVILPKSIRRACQWGAGTGLVVEKGPEGILLKAVPHFSETRPEQVFGCLSHEGEAKSVAEMEAGVMAEARRRQMDIDMANGESMIKASEFKANCLKLMDEVAETGKEYVISKNNRPVARLVPYRTKPKSLFGIDKDKLEILGDVIEPLDVEWEFDSIRGS